MGTGEGKTERRVKNTEEVIQIERRGRIREGGREEEE